MTPPSDRPEPAAPVFLRPESATGGADAAVAGPEAAATGSPSTAEVRAAMEEGLELKGPRVSLERFEGPLDLLLHLIREDELDIGDIPIARITAQYLETIQDLATVDLDLAGEYLVMATTLMRIKAKMLLPRDESPDDEDEEDPRAALVRRLLEYREFKRVAEQLGERQDEWRDIFRRAASPIPEVERDDGEDDLGVDLMELFRAFRDVLSRVERESPFAIESEDYSVEEQMDWIRTICTSSEEGVPFGRLFRGRQTRSLVITTFLALLEMVRLRQLVAHQADRFGEIWLKRATEVESTHES
ncbi:MAG: segregation/condensation protein A [bacterium]